MSDRETIDELCAVLARYVGAYPAFRIKPIGAPGSPARIEQEGLIQLEDDAMVALAKARGEK